MNPAQLAFNIPGPSLTSRRPSRAEVEFDRSEEIKEHARQRAMVEKSIMSRARELKPSKYR